MRRSRLLALASVTAVTGALAIGSPSTAAPAPGPESHTLARHLVVPLSLAVHRKNVYVTQNFGGMLTRLHPGQAPKTLYTSKHGDEVGGVSVRGRRLVFTETAGDGEGNNTDSWLKMVTRHGARTIADIRDFENAHNPDHRITYGIRHISDACAAQWPTQEAGPAKYRGALDSHPYATTQTKRVVYVADAGMNAVLAVDLRTHRVRTVAVTPPVAVKVTQQIAHQMGLPDCVVGKTYHGESVPTDVERGRHGALLVTTEGGGLGEQMPLGAVYRIGARSGHVKKLAGHLMAPTGLGVRHDGTMYVAQLFGGQISRVDPRTGRVQPFAMVKLPAAVELSNGRVYATTNVLPSGKRAPNGKVVRYSR
jgi:DNA-binding beta-propeller fold protein YncE